MRLLDILFYLLRHNSKVTVRELSQEFNVSEKTIRRDLDKLSIFGIPIIYYRGANGGVEIDKNYTIVKHLLKYSDYKSLIFALYIGENISNNIKQSFLIDKFKSVDKDRCTKILNDLKEKFIVDLYDERFDTNNQICETIDEALSCKSCILLFTKDKELEVYPISYVLRKEGLCLYCCNKDYMIIPINKILKVNISYKSYDDKIIKYEENKDNLKFI